MTACVDCVENKAHSNCAAHRPLIVDTEDLSYNNVITAEDDAAMKTAIRKMGNSHGVIIPKPLLAEVGAKANDQVDMGVEDGKIVIAPIRKRPRAGWAEASKRLAATRGGLVWPEFGNDGDKHHASRGDFFCPN
jgi:antitoxin MazE